MKKTIIDIIKDIRKYILIYGISFFCFFILCFINKNILYNIITSPLNLLHNKLQKDIKINFIYTTIIENFNTDITISFYFALLFSLPILLFCIYKFYAKSLFKNEKIFFIKIILISLTMTYLSVLISYFFILPRAINFFIIENIKDNIKPMLKISDYITTCFHSLFWIIIIFHFPLFLFSLVKFKIIKKNFLSKNRKISLVIIFVVSAIITPPDVLSQIICAFILIIVYEITNLVINRKCPKKSHKNSNLWIKR